MRDLPGRELAQELIGASQAEARGTPMEEIVAAARDGRLDGEAIHRLVGRLWALERMFYYIYGGWGQGLEMNDFPPSVKYLFSKQIVDESTHEMLYMDLLLKKRFVANQKDALSATRPAPSGSTRRWPITSSRCATWRPTRTRSASPRSISARRFWSWRGARRWPR